MNMCLNKITHCSNKERIDKYNNKPYELVFKKENGEIYKKIYKHIIIAIPFSAIRKENVFSEYYVNIDESNFSKLKKYAIQHLPMGKNSKLNVQFKTKFWKKDGNNGFIMKNDTYYWDVSRQQKQTTGILVEFKGGNNTDKSITSDLIEDVNEHNCSTKKAVSSFLNTLENIVPGAKKNFEYTYDETTKKISNVNGYCWTHSRWSKGAYSYWGHGQYYSGKNYIDSETKDSDVISFAGYEGVPEPYNEEQTGNCHFAGEHTSFFFKGYMNGAVESGLRVANEIMRLMK